MNLNKKYRVSVFKIYLVYRSFDDLEINKITHDMYTPVTELWQWKTQQKFLLFFERSEKLATGSQLLVAGYLFLEKLATSSY